MAKSPAFRFYPSDFLGSPDVQIMDLDEIGAYTLLLCTAWLSDRYGYLPDDENLLRRWARMSIKQWQKSREIILKKFPIASLGWRCNPRMVSEADKQSKYLQAQSDKGKKGGRPRKPVVILEKPVVLGNKPGVKPAREKPSVSVFVSNEEQPPSDATHPHPDLSGEVDPIKPMVDRLFGYYCEKFGRNLNKYTLTPERRKKAELRLRERARIRGTLDAAEIDASQCIDNLAADDFCVSGGYVDWIAQIFKSAEEFEKQLNKKPHQGAKPNGKPNRNDEILAGAQEYANSIRNRDVAPPAPYSGRTLEAGATTERAGAGDDPALVAQNSLGDW